MVRLLIFLVGMLSTNRPGGMRTAPLWRDASPGRAERAEPQAEDPYDDDTWFLPPQSPPPLTAEQFNAALKEAGFGVERARIVDTSGRCPGFVTTAAFRGRALDRPRTLAKAIHERDAEIARRAAETEPGSMPGVRIATRGKAVQPGVAGIAGTAGDSVDDPLATAAISAAQCSHCQPVLLTGELDTWFAVVTVTRSPIATPNSGPS